jgi:hypothetical protein
MGFAPHTNNDVQHQMFMGIMPSELPIIMGRFVEREYGHSFEYAERRWPDDSFYPELCHIIYVGDNQARLAKVLKTVAFVLTGDGELQKWDIKQHRNYETDWVRA